MKIKYIVSVLLILISGAFAFAEDLRKVRIYGFVERPGEYHLTPDQQLFALILAAGCLEVGTGDPLIRRSTSEGKTRIRNLDLRMLISEQKDFHLLHGDIVLFSSGGPLGGWVQDPDKVCAEIKAVLDEIEAGKPKQNQSIEEQPIQPPRD